MRSIRRGISSSGRTAPSRYSSGSSTSPTLVTDNSTSWKGKDKDTSIASEAHKGHNQHESTSGLQADTEPVLSEFEAVARRYDGNGEDHPVVEVVEKPRRKLWVDNGPPKRLAYYKTLLEVERLPPIPSGSWRNQASVRGKKKYHSGFQSNHFPVPLTFGSGGIEKRVLRYQQARKDRETTLRGFVETLNRSEDISVQGSSFESNGSPSVVPSPQPQSSGTVPRASHIHHWLRGYSSSASASRSTDSPFTLEDVPVSNLATHVEQDSSETLKNATTKSETSNERKPNSIGEVSTQWRREEWGTDQLAPSADSRSSSWSNYSPENFPINPDSPLLQAELRTVRSRFTQDPILSGVPEKQSEPRKSEPRQSEPRQSEPRQSEPRKLDLEGDATSTDVPNHEEPPHLVQGLLLRLHKVLRGKKKAPRRRGASNTKPIELSKTATKRQELALKVKAKREVLGGSRTPSTRSRIAVTREKPTAAPRQQKEHTYITVKGTLEPLHSDAEILEDVQPSNERRPVPRLAHGLDRVLFNPSVHWIQDPHSRVYNFPPTLQSLPAVTEFAFERLGSYMRSSHDKSLRELAQQHRKRFVGSTSSLTSFLSHIYFLISGNRMVDTSTLSMAFRDEARTFTPGIRMPAEVIFHHKRHYVDEGKPSNSTSREEQAGHPSHPAEQPALPPKIDEQITPSDSTKSSSIRENIAKSTMEAPTGPSLGPDGKHLDPLEPFVSAPPKGGTDPTLRNDSELGQTDSAATTVPNGPASPPLDPQLLDDAVPAEIPRSPTTTNISDETVLQKPGSPQSTESFKTVVSEDQSNSREIDIYALDGGSDDPDKRKDAETNVLLWLGTMAEKFLTLPEPAFTALLRKNPVNESLVETPRAESYRYAKSSQFVMRAQLDCQDSRLPGTGVFDIKTRAALPIRIDRLNYVANSGYLIRKMTGLFESFEREYYDLIRSAFLKYNFQARIGNMDGVFVAYHNTARMFGFQYVPVAEMEQRLYGRGHPERGARIFEKCIGLLEAISSEIVACFPRQTVICTAEAQKNSPTLKIWIIPRGSDNKAIEQLTVTVRHTVGGRPATSEEAINNAHGEWNLHYTISRSSRPRHELWNTLEMVNARKFPSALPEGVSQEEMERRIAHVNFGAGKGLDQELPEDLPTPKAKNGSKPAKKYNKVDRRLNYLRQLAKRGWEDIKQESESVADRVVFGVDADEGAIPDADKQPNNPDQTVMPDGATFVSDDSLNAGGIDIENVEGEDTSSLSTQPVAETPAADSTSSNAASSDTTNVLKSYAHFHL